MAITTNTSDVWNSLGSFWGKLSSEEKLIFENVWQSYIDSLKSSMSQIYALGDSYSINSIPPTVKTYDEFFDIVYGADVDTYSGTVNVEIGSGLDISYYFNDDRIYLDIPSMHNDYWDVDGLNVVTGLVATDTDYTISSDGRALNFVNNPPFNPDLNEPHLYKNNLYVEEAWYLNPVLFSVYGAQIGMTVDSFTNQEYTNYNPTVQRDGLERVELAEHFKYLIWALKYYKQKEPTISNLKNALSIARGAPFIYSSGIVDSIESDENGYTIGVNDYSYYVPSTNYNLSVVVGQAVDTFEILVSGFDLIDYSSNPDEFTELSISPAQYKSSLILEVPYTVSGENYFVYDETFYENYYTDILSAGSQFIEVSVSNVSGVDIYLG